ncbi:MAG: RNA polymerase sigma factor [Crocinitomicaceae bacterium]|nr:RNA polymerase sigma factor [Crocinitomicaceae bacterium]
MLFGLFSKRNIKGLTDLELVDLVREDNSSALGEIFQRYSHLVMGLCVKYMKNVQEAEDIMMGLFEKLPSKINRSEIQNFKNWLYSVSRNECLMELRKNSLDTTELEKTEFMIENNDQEELNKVLASEDKIAILEKAIGHLKEEQKISIQLFYIDNKSYDEIVKTTGYDLKKVKSYIQNGKRNLKLILEKESEI